MNFERYLASIGYEQKDVECVCPHCVTASDFALKHPKGKYVLICQDAVIFVIDGYFIDLNGNGNKIVLYYYKMRENNVPGEPL